VPLRAHRRDPLRLRADRFGDPAQVYEGPAFGESPFTVALKLEYDGDYRRTARYALRSAATRTTLVTAQGERRPSSGVARVRLVTLAQNQGWTRWQSAPAPAVRTAFGFHAYTGTHGVATLSVAGQKAIEMPLDATGDYEVEAGPYRLCRRARGERGNMAYGAFVLLGPTERGRPLDLGLRFSTGMSERPMYVVVDSRRAFSDVTAAFDQCQVPADVARASGAATVLDGTHNNYPADTGRWTIAAVY
jgi:hypothetical protein